MIYADTGAYPTWGASFTTMTVTDAKDLIADTITYKSKNRRIYLYSPSIRRGKITHKR